MLGFECVVIVVNRKRLVRIADVPKGFINSMLSVELATLYPVSYDFASLGKLVDPEIQVPIVLERDSLRAGCEFGK